MTVKDHDILTLARTIYGEARGEYNKTNGGLSSLIAVANVICNRAQDRENFANTIAGECLRPWQFSCWNKADPNRKVIADLIPGVGNVTFDRCYTVAVNVARQNWPDLTKGANHYHAPMAQLPSWAVNQKPVATIGSHTFYKL